VYMVYMKQDDRTHFRNCGRRECQELLSCFSVRNSSKVDTVLGSHLMVPICLHRWSFSKLMKSVHPLQEEINITLQIITGWLSSSNWDQEGSTW